MSMGTALLPVSAVAAAKQTGYSKKGTRLGAFFMELMIRFELTTSSLPRTRSTY